MKTLMLMLRRDWPGERQDEFLQELADLGMKQVCYSYYSGMDSPNVYFVVEPENVPMFGDRVDGCKWFDDPKHVLTMSSMELAAPDQKATIERLVAEALTP